jgi:Asp-tRNA(Asn)/Glu-tRNA(Gln) amidotransferase C subunit
MDEIDKIIEDLNKIVKGIDKIEKPDTTIVKDNQFVDTSNVRSKKVLSDTNDAAIHEARYNNIRDAKPLEGDLDLEDTKQNDDEIIDRFVRDFFEKTLG